MKGATVTLLGIAACAGQAPRPAVPVPGSRQLVVVTTGDWGSTTGWLRAYKQVPGHRGWRPVGDSIPIVVGRTGLAWGRGVRAEPGAGEPIKREGDGKSPAGEFQLSHAFGYAPADSTRWLRLRYLQATPELHCVDDPASASYNQLVYLAAGDSAAWASAEDMRRADESYRWGVVVEHNTGWGREPGAGSCIFLHIWSGPASSTAGCTAMDAGRLVELMRWLDPLRTPVLVQLPRSAYDRLRADWDLP